MRIYLSGAIEHAPGHGKAWRAELTPFLKSLGHAVYDPALDEKKNLTAEEVANFRAWKTADLGRFVATVRKIIDYDMQIVEQQTDCVICLWDEYAQKGAGTQAEMTRAYQLGIPVYLLTRMPVEAISGWILGCATEIFPGTDELQGFLAEQLSAVAAKA